MSLKTILWIEDKKGKASYRFWNCFLQQLFDLTRNTGFEISKGTIGECWINSCCKWNERQDDDICGLDSERLSLYDKMKIIYENTCLKEQFKTAGLEVTL